MKQREQSEACMVLWGKNGVLERLAFLPLCTRASGRNRTLSQVGGGGDSSLIPCAVKSAEAGNSWASLLFPAPVISVEGVGGGGPGTQQWTFGVHIFFFFGPSVTHLQICVKENTGVCLQGQPRAENHLVY